MVSERGMRKGWPANWQTTLLREVRAIGSPGSDIEAQTLAVTLLVDA